MYDPASGRFLTRDSWQGDYNRPLSLNRWNYVESNPVNFADPSGYIKQGLEARRADGIWSRLKVMGIVILKDWGDTYNFDPSTRKITTCGWDQGRWSIDDLLYIEEAAEKLKQKLGGPNKVRAAVGQARVNKIDINKSMMSPPGALSSFLGDIVVLSTGNTYDKDWFKFNFVHEFGHVWDYRNGNRLSFNLMKRLGTWYCIPTVSCAWLPSLSIELPPDTCRDPNNRQCTEPPPYPYSSSYGNFPILTAAGAEDWANSLGYFVFPDYRQPFVIGLGTERRKYVKEQIANLH